MGPFTRTAFVPKYFNVKMNLLLGRMHILNYKAILCMAKYFALVMNAIIQRVNFTDL